MDERGSASPCYGEQEAADHRRRELGNKFPALLRGEAMAVLIENLNALVNALERSQQRDAHLILRRHFELLDYATSGLFLTNGMVPDQFDWF